MESGRLRDRREREAPHSPGPGRESAGRVEEVLGALLLGLLGAGAAVGGHGTKSSVRAAVAALNACRVR
ncbi:putative transcriptional regulator, TetR family protein [Streptomyces sp. Tu6071]|nr:putative transcriptional regulator, TetR family protein [Streptomyces sp. Tu6071]